MICKSLSWSKDMVASLFWLSLNGAVVMPQETLQGRNQCGRSRRGCSIFQYKYIQSPSHCCTTVLFLFQTLMALPEEHLLLVGAPQLHCPSQQEGQTRSKSPERHPDRPAWHLVRNVRNLRKTRKSAFCWLYHLFFRWRTRWTNLCHFIHRN